MKTSESETTSEWNS